MDVHACGEEGKTKMDLVEKLIAAIDNLQAARYGPTPQEQDAFEELIIVRDEVSSVYYA